MPKVLVTAEVEDLVRWEEGFRTRGDLMRSFTVNKLVAFATAEGNEVAVLSDPDDLDAFMTGMESEATAEAMEADGVKRETVKTFILDKELQP